ncbi:MAG: hypothetical protein GY847_16000 [Proteobacteria bacterium]|nr:hypothetical protein [Pseudomonadota bacterium]
MSFLTKLLGGTFESNRDEGESLFKTRHFGEARLAFDRALAKSKSARSEDIRAVQDKVRTCKLELAKEHIAWADQEADDGNIEVAVELLEEAQEICKDSEIIEAIGERKKRYDSEDARRLVGDGEEISEEELLAIFAGTWTESQAEEYAALPEDFYKALLAAHDREYEQAKELLSDIVNRSDLAITPCFAWLELGRMRLQSEDEVGALEALGVFLDAVTDDDENMELKVAAHNFKAAALAKLERLDEAKEELILNTSLTPGDHNVFLNLGIFLKGRQEYPGALEALETALELMGQMHPDFRVIRELGFTYLAMDRKQEAAQNLGAVVEHLASRGEHDQFDPETVIALAGLHEEKGDIMQAADLYRHLAIGYDTKNHFVYNLEAARLLGLAGGEAALVERYLTRANELAGNDEQESLVEKVRSKEAP